MTRIALALLCAFVLVTAGCRHDEISSPKTDASAGSSSLSILSRQNERGGKILYSEDFRRGAAGWIKVDGPGLLEVVRGKFLHTTYGYSVWCEYAYQPKTFGNGIYSLDVFIESAALATSFAWRAPNLLTVTANGGAYQVTFNNSGYAPGPAGHFTLEKFDPTGRKMLLDIPQQFLGLNHLTIVDRGTSLQVSINGVDYGTIDVSGLTAPQAGYLFLIGGDRSGGDYFDNIKVQELQPHRK
jgi:hypothetical protein